MKEILESRGWKMYYECHVCGRKQHFTHKDKPGYEVKTRVQHNSFTILFNNRVIAGPFAAQLLFKKLTEHVQ